MPGQYLYNVEFTVDDYDLWTFPENLLRPEELPTMVRFKMDPKIDLKISEEEFFEQINCDKKIVKNAMFSLSEEQVKNELNGKIVVCKFECPAKAVMVGCFKFEKIHCHFKRLMEQFDKQVGGQCANDPCSQVCKQLAQLLNTKDQPSGLVFFTLRMTCFGPSLSKNQFDSFKSDLKKKNDEEICLDRAAEPRPCPSQSTAKGSEFDEYSAEINGNQLIVRINKEDSAHLVTRVFDSNMDQNGNEIQRDKNLVSVRGCDQQIDFRFPKGSSCGECKATTKNFNCGPDSILTEYQRKTSCFGKSFKNSCALPVIRGNLKYPGRFDDGSIKFDLYDKCNPRDATEKYKKLQTKTRSTCLQVDEENLRREQKGKCSLPRGVQVCQRGCSDPNTDVFILKIGSKKTNRHNRKNGIELEMRTPKAPDNEIKKMETREVQVDENDFENKKICAIKKDEAAPVKAKASKGFVKKKNDFGPVKQRSNKIPSTF